MVGSYADHVAATSTRDVYVNEHLHSGFRDILEDIRPGKSIVDIACGSGTLLQALSKKECTVAGFDLSPGAVEMSRSKGLDVVQGNADQFDTDPILVELFARNPDIIIFSKCLVYLARKSDIFRSFKGDSIYVYQSNPGYWRRRLFANNRDILFDEVIYRSSQEKIISIDDLGSLRRWGESFGYTSCVLTSWPILKKNVVVRFDRDTYRKL